ncbi:ABC transporter ATP-binding protein [Ligilactobacillus sp. LYQ60]|uniref:ABC transporter ATP-binding protein n=1 Tax=unclassified Ligilactobacillus TaxID=2767920 RepID=UPI0038537D95
MVLEVDNLIGGYSRIPVLNGISFKVAAGELVGLIGLNGAGKSTTIKHIIGLLQPHSGTIKVAGITATTDPATYHRQIAYLPETPVLYPELTLREHIETTIKAYELDEKQAWERACRLLTMFRLTDRLDWLPVNFSKGMRQKVMIICAFITDAKLLIVDEPFLGLDPVAIHDFLALIKEKQQRGTAVLMTTHVLPTAQRVCDRFVFIQKGRIQVTGTLATIRAQLAMPDASLEEIYLHLNREAIHHG